MNYTGNYRITKTMSMKEDGSGFELADIDALLANPQDEDDEENLNNLKNTFYRIEESGELITYVPIPEGVSKKDIEDAKKAGMLCCNDTGVRVGKSKQVKFEGDDIFLYDEQKMLNGEEWVKLNTDVEGELNFVMAVYTKMD